MSLTPEERRRLRDLERESARDDPAFARSMSGERSGPERAARRIWPWLALIGLVAAVVVAVVAGIGRGVALLLLVIAMCAFLSLGSWGGPPERGGR
ncbi:DUF3040 domain-containing protein [Catellatospora bangladeshensis]|uniref:DUF3040 domain-containing protein n=1 Tax=Catellatospora bangladeshensis TaxID=310355 RepID=A0A8J3JDP5_9ACTN|nr:DUF3040 domain-containing protein [Catellatospora bangladeshensis]GIF83027.1 hypothetical protein Cba03nite_43760 [Catellatospora bangladeshensis]